MKKITAVKKDASAQAATAQPAAHQETASEPASAAPRHRARLAAVRRPRAKAMRQEQSAKAAVPAPAAADAPKPAAPALAAAPAASILDDVLPPAAEEVQTSCACAGFEPGPESGQDAGCRRLLERLKRVLLDGLDGSELESDYWLLSGGTEEARSAIAQTRELARRASDARRRLDAALKGGPDTQEAAACMKLCEAREPEIRLQSEQTFRLALTRAMSRSGRRPGRTAQQVLDAALKRCPEAAGGIRLPVPAKEAGGIVPLQGTDHRFWTRRPVQEWDVYIDETGVKFSEESGGEEGLVAAVCVRQGAKLPDIGSFHCTSAPMSKSVRRLDDLLKSGCGIVGFSRASLGAAGRTGWFPCICELVKWIWRLAPLSPDGHAGLRIHVEQRGAFSADLATEFGLKMLASELMREDPVRADRVRILSFDFEDKSASMLAWADVVACLWGRFESGAYPAFAASGLPGACLSSDAPEALDAAADALSGRDPDGLRWAGLVRGATVPGGIPAFALEVLRKRTASEPALRSLYACAMQSVADRGEDPETLERMAAWLDEGPSSPTLVRLGALSGRVREDCAAGRIAGAEDLGLLASLGQEAGEACPHAAALAAVRLAEAEICAFRPDSAERILAPWNPASGGSEPGSSVLAAEVPAVLGTARAMLRDPACAAIHFGRGLERIGQEPHPLRGRLLRLLSCALADAGSPEAEAACASALAMAPADALEHWNLLDEDARLVLARFCALCGNAELRESFALRFAPDAGDGPAVLLFRLLAAPEGACVLKSGIRQEMLKAPADESARTALLRHAAALACGAEPPFAPAVRRSVLQCIAEIPGAEDAASMLLSARPGNPRIVLRVLPFASALGLLFGKPAEGRQEKSHV